MLMVAVYVPTHLAEEFSLPGSVLNITLDSAGIILSQSLAGEKQKKTLSCGATRDNISSSA